jgi:DUF4097 and DUF4098 domain-containing protein YvlB
VTTPTDSTIDHTIGAEGVLVVSLMSGSIRLRATDGDAVHISDAAGGDLHSTFTIELGPGSATLRSDRGLGIPGIPGVRWGGGVADLEIDLPRRATVVLDGTSAEIDADGLTGEQNYRTVSGDVTLRTVSGRIRVEAVSGDVDVTASGEAAMTVRTVSGDLDLRAATLSGLDVTSMSGDVSVAGRLAGNGPFRVETVSGDALLAPAGDLRIEMTTVSGDLRSEIGGTTQGGRGRRTLVVGDTGPTLSFRSMSGDLRVVRAIRVESEKASQEPAPPAEPPAPPPAPAAPTEPTLPPRAVEGDITERVPVAVASVPDPGPGDAAIEPPPDPMAPPPAELDDERIAILRALEHGEIDVTEAGQRLEALDDR